MSISLDAVIAAVAVIIGLATYVRSTARDKAIRRAELVRAYTSEFYQGSNVVDLFVSIDYNEFQFVNDTTTWLSKQPERTVVQMLDLFNSMGHNCDRGVLQVEDVHGTTLGYAAVRAYHCPGIQEYLQYVKQWDADHLGTGVPFLHFQTLAIALDERSAALRELNQNVPAVLHRPGAVVSRIGLFRHKSHAGLN